MKEKRYTSVEEQVEYGLDSIDESRTIEVSLRDLLYVYQTLGEYVRFLHQPLHTSDLESVSKFLGDRDAGAFHLLLECYYHKLRDVWPQDIQAKFDDGKFDSSNPPYYYQPPG